MKLKCAIVTPKVKDLAKKIGKSNVFTVNLISLYLSQTGKVNPEAEDLTKFLTSKGKDFQNEEFILPTHKTRKVTQKTSFVDTINGEITINVPSQEIKEELFNERKEDFKDDVLSYEKNNDVAGSDLSKLIYLNITNIHDAYMFDLYLEDISNRNKNKSQQEQYEAAIEILLEIKKSKGQPVIENTQQVREAYASRIARENVASVLISDKTTPKNIESLSDEQLNDIINKAGKATIVRNRLSQNETPYVVIGNHIFSQKTGEEKYKEENNGVRKYLLAKRDAIEGKAIPVTITTKEGDTRSYAVYDDNKIFSFTSKKFMADNWADTDITKKAIMEAVERERGKKKEKQKQDSILAQILDHMANNLKLKLHFKSEAEAFLKKSGGKGTMAAINQKPKTLEEILSPHTIQAINTGKWDNKSIEEFNNLITDIQNDRIVFKRIREEATAYSRGISEAHAGASSILGGSERASKKEQRNTQTKRTPKEQLEEDARKGKEQERIIEAWAKAEGLWLNDYTDEDGNKAATLESLLNSQWDYINQGSEAEVYLYDNKTVLKSISLLHSNDNVAKALDKIALFNHLFPKTAMQVVGFGRDSLGHFRIIVTQPYVKGEELTDEELDDFYKKQGFSKSNGWITLNGNIARITDLGNYNILKDKDGNYFVIDADVEYLTPENGGNAVFENTFEPNINTGDNDVYMFMGKKAREKYAEILKKTRPDENNEDLPILNEEIRRREVVRPVTPIQMDDLDSDLPFFQTPQGEVYGFVTKNGEIYLDETKISPEHPIHEYTHLWDMVVQKKKPELWAKGISLLQQFNNGKLWNSIAEDENYGKKWKEAGITGEKLTNLIASEVHARLVGKGGEELLNKAAKEKGQAGLVAKIKSWILDIWKSLKSTFGISGEDINKLTLKDFNHMTVRDFFLDEIKIQEALDEMTIVVGGVAKIKSSSFSFANEPLHPAFQGKKIASFKVTSGSVKTPLSNPVQDSTPPTDSSEDIRETSAENPYIQVNRDFTAEERHNRVAMISRKFSEAVDDIMNEAAEALGEQIANADDPVEKASLQADLDKINKSFDDDGLEGRHVALRLQGFGVDVVLKRLRENLIQNSQDNSIDTNRRIAYAKCVDNFLMLLREAATDIEWREGLKITFFPSKGGKSIDVANADEKITDDDAKLIDSEFKDDEFGERVPGNAGWSYNTREVNPKDTLGATVKRIIDNIPVYDSNGLPAVDDVGYSKYLDHNYVHAILLEEMSELKSPEEFAAKNADGSFDFVALKKMAVKYPWAWNIISELQSNPEEIAAFYSDLRMDFISYWGAFKNPKIGVWQNKRLNNTNAKEAIVTQVVTMFEQGGERGLNTIFIGNGKINIELAKKVNKEFDDFMDKQGMVNGEKTLAEIINSLSDEDKVVFAKIIQKQLEAIGFNVAIKQIFNWLQDYESYRKVLPAVAASGGILGEIEQAKYKNGKTLQLRDKRKTHGYVKGLMMDIPDGNAFFKYFSNYYYKIAETIGVMGEDTKTGSFMQDGKQYYSYSTPNYMDTQMKYFLDDEKRSSYIQEHFKKYAWFYHKRYNGEEFQYNDDKIKELTTTPAVTNPTTFQIDPEIQKTDLSFLPSEYYYDYITGKLSFTEDELKDVSFDENTHHWEFVGDKKVYNSNFETKVRNINKFIDLLREYNNFRNDWLFQIENNPEIREKLEFKEVKTIKDKEADRKLRHTTYENWMPWQVSFAMIQEFWSETEGKFEDTEKDSFAWYSFPIFSDSKVAKYVRFRKFVDDKTGTVEGKITKRLVKVAFQELYRINHVRRRKAARDRGENVKVIANYDKNGSKFCFFTEFNDYRVRLDDNGNYSANDEGEFVIFDSYSEKAPEDVKSVSLIEALFDKNINDVDRYNLLYESISKFLSDSLEKFRGEIEGKTLKELESYSKSIKCIKGKPEEVVEKLIHDYFYNQVFATTQIIQISAVDLAFYKNSDDFEKRFKQLYAAGAKLFTSSRYGAESYKAVTLVDNEATSLSYSDIASSLDEDVKAKRISASDAEDIKQSLLHINMADGQAYRSLDGYREVMDMMGRWTDELEETYKHIKSGSWTSVDFNRIFQTIKPFVYTQLDKPDGLGKSMLVPYQVKDSESVLLAAYMAVALGSEKNQNSTQYVSPKMRGIARFMEKHGVRVVQFQSAVKVGDMGDININISHSKLRQWSAEIRKELDKALANKSISQEDYDEAVSHVDENAAINDLAEYFKDILDKRLASKEINEKQYRQIMKEMQPSEDEVVEILENSAYPNGQEDEQVVDTIPYSGYMIAQPTPEDLVDKKVVVGTQFETLITSDLPEDFKINFGGKELNRQEVLDLYNKIKVENIIDGFSKLKDIFGDIEKLQKELVRMVLSSPGYGRNLIEALELVDVDNGDGTTHKEFNIPTDNPTTANSLLRLIHAMFRNKVQRQEIKGGACILVSSYGYTNQLHTVYNKDGSIKYFECYLPASSKKLYNDFIEYDENGNPYVDPAKIPDELRRGIGYRIPTEDKYSMVHFYIKGFLPPFSGSKVMLPMEAVFFSGEDFDVDKKYLMLPTFKVERYDISRARRDFMKADASMKNISSLFAGTILEQMFSEEESSDVEDNTKKEDAKKAWREWWKAHKDEYLLEKPIVEKVRYDINKPMYKQSREARDNMMIDLAYKILQHRDTASKIQNPGNYTKIKREALMYRILNDGALTRKWIESQGLKEDNLKDIEKSLIDASVGTLKKFIDSHARQRSSLVPDSFVYYHDQNMTGKKLVGSFAIVSSMHAKYEEVPLSIKKDFRFTIDGITYDDLDKIISEQGERISKNCASCLAAAPDTAKDPVLADVNFTTDTASTVGLMLRAGLTIQQAALFLKQPIVDTWVKSGESLNTLYEMLTEAIAKSGWDISAIKKAGTTSQTLLENILKHTLRKSEDSTEYSMDEVVAAMMFYNIALTARDLNNLTTISRADTDKGSIASSPAGLYRQKLMVENLRIPNIEKNMRIDGFLNTLRNNVVDVKHDSKDDIRSALLNSSMPRLQAYYTLGIDSAMPMLKEYFPQYSDTMQGIVGAIDRNSNMIAIPETVIAAALKDLTNFYLSGTELFGNDKEHTFEEKRRYYICSFPQRFVQMAATNEHLKDYKALRMLNVENGSIVLKSNVKMRNDEKEQYQIDFERMLFDQDKEVRAFAVDLFKYCYYRYGLTISPLSYEGFFSTGFIKQIKGYTEALAEMPSVLSNNTSLIQGFLEQFYANRYDVQGVLPMLQRKENTYFNGEFRFDKAFVTSNKTGEIFPRAIVTSKKGYRTLVFTGKFSTVDVEVNGNTASKEYAVYKEVKNINHGATQQVLYNRNASLSDLLAYAEADEEAAKNSAMANSNPIDDYIMSPDSFEGGPEVENGSVEYEGDMEDLASVFESEVGASNLPQAPDIDTITEPTVDQNSIDEYDLTGIDDSIFTDPDPFGKLDDGDDNYVPDDTVGFC